jgi:hypothetical protein
MYSKTKNKDQASVLLVFEKPKLTVNVKQYSNYPDEKEVLIFGGNSDFEIISIETSKKPYVINLRE